LLLRPNVQGAPYDDLSDAVNMTQNDELETSVAYMKDESKDYVRYLPRPFAEMYGPGASPSSSGGAAVPVRDGTCRPETQLTLQQLTVEEYRALGTGIRVQGNTGSDLKPVVDAKGMVRENEPEKEPRAVSRGASAQNGDNNVFSIHLRRFPSSKLGT